jgi:hypothetical protein
MCDGGMFLLIKELVLRLQRLLTCLLALKEPFKDALNVLRGGEKMFSSIERGGISSFLRFFLLKELK